MYDLKNDPYELRNVNGKPEYEEVAERMKKALRAKLKELGDSDPIATEKSLVKGGGKDGGGKKRKRK